MRRLRFFLGPDELVHETVGHSGPSSLMYCEVGIVHPEEAFLSKDLKYVREGPVTCLRCSLMPYHKE